MSDKRTVFIYREDPEFDYVCECLGIIVDDPYTRHVEFEVDINHVVVKGYSDNHPESEKDENGYVDVPFKTYDV